MKTLILLFSVLFTTMSFAQVPSYIPNSGLVGWWPFNGNANDESGNGNNGTVNGATLTTDRNGVVNSAYNFSGTTTNTEIITGDCSSFPSGNSPRSISIWYYGINTSTTYQQLFGYGGETCGQSFIMNFNNPDLGPTVNPTGKYEVQGHCQLFRNYASSALPLDNYWHQIILTYDGSVFRFYNDGNLVSTSSPTTLNVVTLSKIYCFGKETNQSGTTAYFQDGIPGFNGKLDDIGIWNRALTDCEIQNLYTSTNPSNTTSQTACNSYIWNGQAYTQSGVYTGTTTNCVTESLNLTIIPSSNNTTLISACNSYTWNGTSYTASGVYTGTTANCVTESLNLTITPSSTNTTTITSLDSYTWDANGVSYTQSGLYTGPTVSCVTQYLNLTINSSGISEEELALFSIYPNPVVTILYIDYSYQKQRAYLIFDNFGSIVKKGFLEKKSEEISVFELSSGFYYFHLEGTKPRKFSKIN